MLSVFVPYRSMYKNKYRFPQQIVESVQANSAHGLVSETESACTFEDHSNLFNVHGHNTLEDH